ncbi:exonuclease domain-containing protein [Streptomyces sp. NPDC058637]|uniref:exonuclease domain-containing protein n=1 Tax=Streptomyces sp. NPDC058637 TaxID=3346569 RepID=UPI0036509ACC
MVTLGPDGVQTGEFSALLDPGCDPGPVHVHGLTASRPWGAPSFGQVAERIAALLKDRVPVAHNAQFDYGFLAHEFAWAELRLRGPGTARVSVRAAPPAPVRPRRSRGRGPGCRRPPRASRAGTCPS